MSFYNGVLNFNHFMNSRGLRGLPGIGFKLDANNDYDMQNKKLVNVKQGTNNNDVVTKSQLDSEIAKIPSVDTTQFVKKTGATMNGDLILQPQPYPIRGNTNKAISYNAARNIFLSKKEGGSMLQPLDMNNHFITNIKDPVNSDHGVNKKYVDNQLAKKLDKDTTIDMKNKSIINLNLPTNPRDATCVEFVNYRLSETQKNYLKLDGTTSMSGDLNLNNNKIVNLQTDSKNSKSAVNVELMENKITDLKNLVTQKIHESQIINSGQKKDAFRYLMENDDESSSESNIQVLGIVNFPNSPHQINKKAYQLKLLFQKSLPNQYQSRLGFNLYKLPVGYYTLVVEWFPPEMSELSVTVQGTTISISNYATKTFENYTKTVINFHRWGSSPPQFIYLNLNGTVTFPSLLTIGHLIVYGVKETISNVDPSVYDTAFAIENGKMVMETKLDMNNHKIINLDDPLNEGDACNKRSLNIVERKFNNLSSNLSETLFWESYQLADCLYKIERGIPAEVTFDNSSREVSHLFDQSLKENDSTQTTKANRPILCTKAEKINYRYYLKFDGNKRMLSNINLNPGSGQDDIVNIFIVYRLNSYTGPHLLRNGLFGHDDGAGYDKFVAFSANKSMIIAGTTGDYIVIGPSAYIGKNPIVDYQSRANAGELNKWICLSIHWDVPGGNNASQVWCNGKKLANFTARTSPGSNTMTFGDFKPAGRAGLKGDIAFYCLYKGENLTETNIKLHHQVLCKWYAVNHDPISLN